MKATASNPIIPNTASNPGIPKIRALLTSSAMIVPSDALNRPLTITRSPSFISPNHSDALPE
ncbi:MAG: hypothetical protein SVY15_00580 [Halobacteriota archaeon]|nr:hypothetical protein [Halobacteriota archaeon]